MDFLRGLLRARPAIEPQVEAADCGYVCISAVLALLGEPKAVEEIKQVAGTTSRGLTLKQVRDGLAGLNVTSDAIFFDKHNLNAYPDLGILLLDRGHFVVVARKRGQSLEIYDPMVGWSWTTLRHLKRSLSGFAILVRDEPQGAARGLRPRSFHRRLIASTLDRRSLWKAVALFACAQLVALGLPLVSMLSVELSVAGARLGFGGIVLVGFLALSLVNVLTATVGEFVQARLKQKMYRRLGGLTFDALAAKRPGWFDTLSAASIHNQASSLQLVLDFAVDSIRAAATLVIGLVAGLAALIFISPWLAVPGLVSLALTAALDTLLTRRQRGLMSASVEAGQRRQAFLLGTLVQMPLIARHGSARACRTDYVRHMARIGTAAASLQVLQGWRTSLTALLKSSETLVFVTLAAWFMSEGHYSIGGFVALGAYKDLLAGALSAAFQLGVRHNMMTIHRIQAGMLLDAPGDAFGAGMDVVEGALTVRNVSFHYGTLDAPALHNVSFNLAPGQCLVVKGPSGSGKTTLAKLLTGLACPSEGEIRIDGRPVEFPVRGLSAVLQTDRLISASIRDNIALYRRGVGDAEIWRALQVCVAEEFVAGLPMRLNTLVAEGMAGLSGGQRQRILLARAVLGNPKILLLDEATASLDVDTERDVIGNLRALSATLIVISHRPEVWSFGDRVLNMGGESACAGAPEDSAAAELIEKPGAVEGRPLRRVCR